MTLFPQDVDARRRLRARVALGVFVVVIAMIVFWPSPPAQDAQEGLDDLLRRWHARGLPRWISFSLIESVSNLVMFVPVGFFGALSLARHRWLILVAAAAAAGLIELTQQTMLPDRFADSRDVLANAGGAAAGLLLAWVWDRHRVRRDRDRLARTGRAARVAEPTPALRRG